MTNGERFFRQARRFSAGILYVFQGKSTQHGGKSSGVIQIFDYYVFRKFVLGIVVHFSNMP